MGASRQPSPGLGDLPESVDRIGHAGITPTLTVRGGDRVPAGAGLAVYRIAQEGLTNASRYAPGATCRVEVVATRTEVRIDVVDDGPAVAAPPRDRQGGTRQVN